MKKNIILFSFLISQAFSASANDGGSWITSWLFPATGLFWWAVITFLLVLFVLRWKAWGPLMEALDAREQKIEESLNKAEKIIADQELSAQENEKILKEAKKEANNIILEAKDAGEKLKQKLESDGQSKYDSLLDKAKKDINNAKDQALNEIKTMVVSIALEASEKVIKRNLNNEDNKTIIENTVKEFQQNN